MAFTVQIHSGFKKRGILDFAPFCFIYLVSFGFQNIFICNCKLYFIEVILSIKYFREDSKEPRNVLKCKMIDQIKLTVFTL